MENKGHSVFWSHSGYWEMRWTLQKALKPSWAVFLSLCSTTSCSKVLLGSLKGRILFLRCYPYSMSSGYDSSCAYWALDWKFAYSLTTPSFCSVTFLFSEPALLKLSVFLCLILTMHAELLCFFPPVSPFISSSSFFLTCHLYHPFFCVFHSLCRPWKKNWAD